VTTGAWLHGSRVVAGNVTGVEDGASGSVELLLSASCESAAAETLELQSSDAATPDSLLHTALWVADNTGSATWEISHLPPTAFSPLSLVTKVYREDGTFLGCTPVVLKESNGNTNVARFSDVPSTLRPYVASRRVLVDLPSEVTLEGYSGIMTLAGAIVLLCMLCCTCGAVRYCCTAYDPPLIIGAHPDKKSGASSAESAGASSPSLHEEETAVDQALVELRLHRPHFTEKGLVTDDEIVSASNADLTALGLSMTQIRLFRRKMDPLSSDIEM